MVGRRMPLPVEQEHDAMLEEEEEEADFEPVVMEGDVGQHEEHPPESLHGRGATGSCVVF